VRRRLTGHQDASDATTPERTGVSHFSVASPLLDAPDRSYGGCRVSGHLGQGWVFEVWWFSVGWFSVGWFSGWGVV